MKRMQSKFMKKYIINSDDSSMENFEEFYTAAMKKTKCIKFKHNLMKTMRESALKKLNHQKELLMRSDAIIVHVNDTFSSCQQLKLAEKSKSKTVSNTVIQSQLDDLNSKAEILQLDILSLSESLE